MTSLECLDRRGRRIPQPVWGQLHRNPVYAHLCCDVVRVESKVAEVHTFWVGVAGRCTTVPLLFRTVLVRRFVVGLPQ